jgi:hypothetical protein
MEANGSDRASVVGFMEAQLPGVEVLSSYPIMFCPRANTTGYTVRFKDANGAERRWNLKYTRGSGLELMSEINVPDRRHSGEWPGRPLSHGEIRTGVQKPGFVAMGAFQAH